MKPSNAQRDDPYAHAALERLVFPRSIAIIGASETAGSFGAATLRNVLRSGYQGRVYPVNPKRDAVFGERCFAQVADLPEAPDCAVVVVPAADVERTLAACADKGTGGAIVYSSGFAELRTRDAVDAQRAIAELAVARNLRVVGPNCIGIANIEARLGLTFMPSFHDLRLVHGPIGIVTQSGALGYMLLQAMRRSVGFSHWLTTGNACDVDVADFVNYLVDEEGTRAVACSFEGLSNPERFLVAARRALEVGKPLVVLKVGRTEASRQAALSHTGALVGSDSAYRAALDRVGAVVVDDFEALVETAGFLAKAGPPRAGGAAVVTMSGGAGIMALDLAMETGVEVPQPDADTVRRIAKAIPAFGSAANPADLTGESIRYPAMFADTVRAFANDPSYGIAVVVMASGGYGQLAIDRARLIEDTARAVQIPVAVVWLNEWLEGPGSEVYDGSSHLTLFRSLRRTFAAVSQWQRYYERRPRLIDAPRLSRRRAASGNATFLPDPRGRALTERRSKELLGAYGVPITREALATTRDDAVATAARLGYPVVLKAESADIPHKSDAGVVRLKLGDEAAVRRAWKEIEDALARLPGIAVEGMIVQEMIGPGIEVIVGARVDDQFGPLITCGLGGVAVEIWRDVAVALAPVDSDEALAMIRSLKGYRLLTGFRGSAAVDVAAFADIVSRVSRFAWEYADAVAEIDVNPVILGPSGGTAVDALVVTAASQPAEPRGSRLGAALAQPAGNVTQT